MPKNISSELSGSRMASYEHEIIRRKEENQQSRRNEEELVEKRCDIDRQGLVGEEQMQ